MGAGARSFAGHDDCRNCRHASYLAGERVQHHRDEVSTSAFSELQVLKSWLHLSQPLTHRCHLCH